MLLSDWCLINTVLDFLPLVLPLRYSLSLECSRYNASSTSNSANIRASEELGYCLGFLQCFLFFENKKMLLFQEFFLFFHFFRSLNGCFCQLESTYHTIAVFLCLCFNLYIYLKKILKCFGYSIVIGDAKI